MTATAEQVPVRLDFDAHAPAFAKALAHLQCCLLYTSPSPRD